MSTHQKFEYICIMPDVEGAQAKRLEIRPLHFAGLQKHIDDGFITWGGAMLNEVPTDDKLSFRGSVLTCVGTSKEEVVKKLEEDPYVKHGVWDMEKAQIYPFKCAVRQPLPK